MRSDPDVQRGAFGVVNGQPPLTREEVEELPESTQVTVIWSGGNGPAEYVVSVDRNGERYVWDGENEQLRFYNPLTFAGGERFHTRVWRGHGLIAPTPHVERRTPMKNGQTYCSCGSPWPCQHARSTPTAETPTPEVPNA